MAGQRGCAAACAPVERMGVVDPDHPVRAEEVERFERAFEELSEEHREVISLAHLVGLSRAEIAVELDKTEVAVRSLLYRGLARLAELLETHGGAR